MIESTNYWDIKRSMLSDLWLRIYYDIILRQCENGLRCDETLIGYINELEYRGLDYENR